MNSAEAWGVLTKLVKDSTTVAAAAESAQMTGAESIRTFVLAGNATFTLVSKKTGARFTYRVRMKKTEGVPYIPGPWFVQVLTGPNNEQDFEFLGTVFAPTPIKDLQRAAPDYHVFRHGKKSRVAETAPSAKAFAWFFEKVFRTQVLPETCDFYHEGRCGRCGRKLTVPESIASGLGPECASRAA